MTLRNCGHRRIDSEEHAVPQNLEEGDGHGGTWNFSTLVNMHHNRRGRELSDPNLAIAKRFKMDSLFS